jgi:diacylglycerol kinase (ATP)
MAGAPSSEPRRRDAPPEDPRRGRRPLAASFRFAWDGLAEGAVRDRNLRIHLGLGVLAGAFVARAPLEPAERALLALCVPAVIAAEAMNAAVEATVDLASPRWDERARRAKDSAAAAVLALAAGSVLALLAIAAGRLDALREWAGGVAPLEALAPGAAALVAALAAGLLPAPARRSRGTDALLLAAGAVGLAVLAAGAASLVGIATAALCLAVAAGAARRRRGRHSS